MQTLKTLPKNNNKISISHMKTPCGGNQYACFVRIYYFGKRKA
jgi:hypothetical protein